MLALHSLYYNLLKFPVWLLVRCKIVPDNLVQSGVITAEQPIFYVIRHQAASDLLALQMACKKLNLPDPLEQVVINDQVFSRTICLEKTRSLYGNKIRQKTNAVEQGIKILEQHQLDASLNAQLIPVNLTWGRTPTKENNKASISNILADHESPTWLRKFFIVLIAGRNTLARFSDPISFRYMTDQHGDDEASAHKLLRIARFHFYRQTIAATGPRLMDKQQMFAALFANPAIKRLLAEEAKITGLSKNKIDQQALTIMKEIAGDYRDSMVRFGERLLTWLWKRLYKSIEVGNANTLRKLAQEGHEIIYVPCHRSHMDYLLLTYIIFHEGLVTPRIAAGINLSFWPAGPIFRKAGAFFIRRSFDGNRLYSTIFKEYLGLLFERGYSVKYYCEGGRSRTGRLITPKTGMLAMTIQSLLRGVQRPLTLVPVYIGYEHVMEVGTYHKELSGSQKQGESILGVIRAIKNLRNYGRGYVNFGEPININQFLNDQVPEWKSAIDPFTAQKPSWLTPSVNILANQIMASINQSAALNGVALVALILHATKNNALTKLELEHQLDFFLAMQRQAPFSQQLTVPIASGKELLAEVIALNKVSVSEDSFGTIISLSETALLEMRYYRNNILHCYVVPSLVCRMLEAAAKVKQTSLISQIQCLVKLIKPDLYLYQTDEDVQQQVTQVLTMLAQADIAKHTKAGFWSLADHTDVRANIRCMGECIDETMQRFTIISSLVMRLAPIKKNKLEEKVVSIAKRLSVLNNISAPEFIDHKAQAILINAMIEQGYILLNDHGELIASGTLNTLKVMVTNLVDIEVLQSIAR